MDSAHLFRRLKTVRFRFLYVCPRDISIVNPHGNKIIIINLAVPGVWTRGLILIHTTLGGTVVQLKQLVLDARFGLVAQRTRTVGPVATERMVRIFGLE